MKKILFALLFVFSFCGSLSAEETVYFGVKPPEGKIRFSDEFSFKMNVSYSGKYDALPDTSTAGNSYFDVLSFEKTGEVSSGTLKTSTWKISAQAFCLETSTFPALTWTLMDKGTPVSKAKSPEFKIKAEPLFDPKKVKESDIKDVYPPFKFPNWLLIIIALMAAAAFGFYVYRRLTEKNIITFGKQPWKDTRSPYQRAYDRSMVLENSSLLKMDKIKEYYTGLVAVLRFYLQEEYGIDAELFTTRDLAKQMKQYGINVANISKTRAFLSHADMVKFAKMKPKSTGSDLAKLRDLLQSLDMEHTPADIGAAGEPGAYIPPYPRADSDPSGNYGYEDPNAANATLPPPPPTRRPVNTGMSKSPSTTDGHKDSSDDSRWKPAAGHSDDRYMPPAPGKGGEK